MGKIAMLRVAGYGLVGLMLGVSAARAETTLCTAIISLPAVITLQGVYCLTGDLTTAQVSGNAIDIQTNNVIIDLNGHKLGGQSAGVGTQAVGIHALDRRNITVKNGTVRGFYRGVWLQESNPTYINSSGHVIEGLRADFNTAIGIAVWGTGNIVRNNQVVSTGGSTVNTFTVEGINAQGPAARVLNNDVIATTPATVGTSFAIGVYVGSALGSVVEGNRIANTTCPGCSAVGITVEFSDATSVSANRVSNASAVAGSTGVSLITNSADALVSDNRIARFATGINFVSASGSYMNNQVTGATAPYLGGTPAGTTNY